MPRLMTIIKTLIISELFFYPGAAFAEDGFQLLRNFITLNGLYLSAIVVFFLTMLCLFTTFFIYRAIKIVIAVKNA